MVIFKLLNEGEKGSIFMLPTFLFVGKPAAVRAMNYGNVGIMLNSTNSKDAPQSGTNIKNIIKIVLRYH